MADVDRGQLILLTGVVLVIGLTALTLLLNMAIFSENLASRGTDTGAADAMEFRQVSIDSIHSLIEEENDEKHPSHAAVYSNVSGGIDAYDEITTTRNARLSTVADLSNTAFHNGSVLRQNTSRDFTNKVENKNWTLAEDVSETRNFVLTFDEANATPLLTPQDETAQFNISLIGSSGNRWSLYVYNQSDVTGEYNIEIKNGSDSDPSVVCDSLFNSLPATVNLSNGSIDGSDCSKIELGKGVSSPYDIHYTWGNRSEGTYNLTVNSSITNGFEEYQEGQPYKIPVMYSVSFEITYRTNELHYRERIRILPGEPI